MSEPQPANAIVVIVPFPAQGHLGPTLRFSHKLLSYNIPVHYVSSPSHVRQVKARAQTHSPNLSNLHFHDFPIPPFPSPPPAPTAAVKFPTHLQPSFQAHLHLRQPLTSLVRALSTAAKRVVIVHDPLLSSVVQDIASIPNAETYGFHTNAAFFSCLFRVLTNLKPSIPRDAYVPIDKVPSLQGIFTPEFLSFVAGQDPFARTRSGDLYNSSRLLEGAYLDIEAQEQATKQWAIGPLIPTISTLEGHCFDWLNKQDKNSVIYISFGTTTSVEDDQIKEIAVGLEQSKIKFIWVMRDADRGDIFTKDMITNTQLPQGFEERTEGMGMVITDWAPQLEILSHPSIGGFMTHCGWNSCLESITMGVPVAAWPMHSDQPSNSVLLTKLLKIGVLVREWEQREEIVRSATVTDAVRRLMASQEGDEMRNRAKKLGGDVRESTLDGGAARKELEAFVAHITR